MKKLGVILVAEIGSTTTVVNAFNVQEDSAVFIGQGQSATTVADGDVRIGLENAITALKENIGDPNFSYERLLATSSAAGGLKMTVHGLVYDMTTKAAKEAALGAGANIHLITAGKMTDNDIKRIEKLKPNIVMIAGGVDFGEKETAIYNSQKIADLDFIVPVLYAGNIQTRDEVKAIFESAGKAEHLYIVENVFPKIDTLNVEPARRVIQDIFEKHIINAPGMEHIKEKVTGSIVPTPGAVMQASIVLKEAIGDLMTVDVGGATTDIHSVTEGSEEISRILISPEPSSKRTVEGDLGLYVNMKNIVNLLGTQRIADQLNISLEEADELISNHPPIPKTENDLKFAEILAKEAIRISSRRHAGGFRSLYGGGGKKTYAEGKDLTSIQYIVGTGGAATRLPNRRELLSIITENPLGDKLLPTEEVEVLIDNDYIMASLGALAKENKEAALTLLLNSINKDREESKWIKELKTNTPE